MKTIRTLSTLVLLLLGYTLFYGCKKEDAQAAPPEALDCRILTINTGSTAVHDITYNSEGKIATITETLSGFTFVKNFQYSGNMIVINVTKAGSFHRRETITLNTQGMMETLKTEKNASGTSWDKRVFEYSNGGKQLINITKTSSTGGGQDLDTFTWKDGNPFTWENDVIGNVTFDYYPDKPGARGDYFYWSQVKTYGSGRYLASKNLLKSIKQGSTLLLTIEYKFDDRGNIIQMEINDGSPQRVTTHYQYLCN